MRILFAGASWWKQPIGEKGSGATDSDEQTHLSHSSSSSSSSQSSNVCFSYEHRKLFPRDTTMNMMIKKMTRGAIKSKNLMECGKNADLEGGAWPIRKKTGLVMDLWGVLPHPAILSFNPRNVRSLIRWCKVIP
jgi:hypothetical protein